jgi:alpha-L-fucosidase
MQKILLVLVSVILSFLAYSQSKSDVVSGEHGMLNIKENKSATFQRTQHPDAQWFGESENSFGYFIHWSICSVKKMNISWVMIAARSWESPLGSKHISDSTERQRIIDKKDYYLDGRSVITPNEYWEQAKDFNPSNYNPDKWIKAAADAGMKYAVLTCRHHDGFALWPSNYGNFSTKNYLHSRDFVAEYVKACRKYKLKVGLYYSSPDWYFEREYKNFLDPTTARINPELPELDANLEPRIVNKSKTDIAEHRKAYMIYIKSQIEELLTKYGKIDILWFDGYPFAEAKESITMDRIRQLQPGIIVNPRMHGYGDFKTFERNLPMQKPDPSTWYEYNNPWCSSWVYMDEKPRHSSSVIGELVRCKSLGINYLLDVGPMANGDLQPEMYEGLAEVKSWMKTYSEAVNKILPLPATETASVFATASENNKNRYLFLLTKFSLQSYKSLKELMLPAVDEELSIQNISKPKRVLMMKSRAILPFTYENNSVKIIVPKSFRSAEVDVVKVEL